jgi:leucyl-tRNA synthetase
MSPIIPHFCEELFQRLGKKGSIIQQPWPEYREDSLETDEMVVVVQINGKLRSKFVLSAKIDDEGVKQAAFSDDKIQKYIGDITPKKVIVIRKKQALVNIVI